MGIGKLYNSYDEQFLTKVNYNLLDGSNTGWWGELTLVDYMRLNDGDTFMIEMEDGRKGRCSLRKRVNRAVSGVPPRYTYHFGGIGALE